MTHEYLASSFDLFERWLGFSYSDLDGLLLSVSYYGEVYGLSG